MLWLIGAMLRLQGSSHVFLLLSISFLTSFRLVGLVSSIDCICGLFFCVLLSFGCFRLWKMPLLCDPWPWWLFRVDPSSCVCSVGGLSGLLSFFIFFTISDFPYYKSRFFFLILRKTCFSFWYRTWRSNRDVCLSVLGFSVFSCYIFFPWISLSFSVYIWKDDLFLTKPLYLWFLLLDFFFGIKICYLKISRLLLGLFIVGLSTIFFALFRPFWFFSLHLFYGLNANHFSPEMVASLSLWILFISIGGV